MSKTYLSVARLSKKKKKKKLTLPFLYHRRPGRKNGVRSSQPIVLPKDTAKAPHWIRNWIGLSGGQLNLKGRWGVIRRTWMAGMVAPPFKKKERNKSESAAFSTLFTWKTFKETDKVIGLCRDYNVKRRKETTVENHLRAVSKTYFHESYVIEIGPLDGLAN